HHGRERSARGRSNESMFQAHGHDLHTETGSFDLHFAGRRLHDERLAALDAIKHIALLLIDARRAVFADAPLEGAAFLGYCKATPGERHSAGGADADGAGAAERVMIP